MWWWWVWLAFVFIFLLLPLGYGWGYRDWGPPYPTYVRRRRLPSGKILEERVYEDDRSVAVRQAEETSGWGVLADVLWVVFVAAVIWWIVAWWV